MGIKAPVMSTVYYTIAHFLLVFLRFLSILTKVYCIFAQYRGGDLTRLGAQMLALFARK